MLLCAVAGARLLHLQRLARRRGTAGREGAERPGLARQWAALARPLVVRTLVLFLFLENAEHLRAHGHLEGLAIYLAPDALWVAPLLAVAAAGLALLGALVRWRERVLIARLSIGRARLRVRSAPNAAPVRWELIAAACRHRLILLASDLGRAPPVACA
jgi:hypothetical protein